LVIEGRVDATHLLGIRVSKRGKVERLEIAI
jgi:hypothetical protein